MLVRVPGGGAHRLGGASAEVWRLLGTPATADEVVARALGDGAEDPATRRRADEQVHAALAQLTAAGLVTGPGAAVRGG